MTAMRGATRQVSYEDNASESAGRADSIGSFEEDPSRQSSVSGAYVGRMERAKTLGSTATSSSIHEFRDKHQKCIEVLRKKANRGVAAALPEEARAVAMGSGAILSPAGGTPGSLISSFSVQPAGSPAVVAAKAAAAKAVGVDELLKALKELKDQQDAFSDEAATRYLSSDERITAFSEQVQATGSGLKGLESVLQAQNREASTVRAQDQEAQLSLRTLIRESLESTDKMSALRAQESQFALEKLRDALATQAEDGKGRARDVIVATSSIQEQLQASARELSGLQPQVRDVHSSVSSVQRSVEASDIKVGELAAQSERHHQEQRKAFDELRSAFQTQQQCEALRVELAECRRREAMHDAAVQAWQQEVQAWEQERGDIHAQVQEMERILELQSQQQQQQEDQGGHPEAASSTLAKLSPPRFLSFVKGHRQTTPRSRGQPAKQARPLTLAIVLGVFAVFAVFAACLLGAVFRRGPPPAAERFRWNKSSGRTLVLPWAPSASATLRPTSASAWAARGRMPGARSALVHRDTREAEADMR
mmetsp:Transcript_120443/g.384547  ORF Transcript_120443/g.384547 Transcript_120443/m.384547 type:complete len:537 (-) Transcript_120443:193-1803(-)